MQLVARIPATRSEPLSAPRSPASAECHSRRSSFGDDGEGLSALRSPKREEEEEEGGDDGDEETEFEAKSGRHQTESGEWEWVDHVKG